MRLITLGKPIKITCGIEYLFEQQINVPNNQTGLSTRLGLLVCSGFGVPTWRLVLIRCVQYDGGSLTGTISVDP